MNKVVTIHLAGVAYQLEEQAYEKMRTYLDEAKAVLEGNPDQDEILVDIESAIGEKCAARLNQHKNVLTLSDVEAILLAMGPVSDSENASESAAGAPPKPNPKRLYRVREGAWICGVSTGLAAYFDLDVALVRVLWVLLTVLTHGAAAFVYFVMVMIVPEAQTPEERANASGHQPMTAQELIDRAKQGYADLKNSGEWRNWKHRLKEEKRYWKKQRHQWRAEAARYQHDARTYQYGYQPHRSPFWEFMNAVLGLVWFCLIVAIGYWGYNHVIWFHNLLNQFPDWLSQTWEWLKAWWTTHVK